MDEYNCCELGDAKDLADKLLCLNAIVFPLSFGTGTCLIVEMSLPHPVGTFPFGGNPRGRVWVSVYGIGANHFSQEIIHPSYFEEKLKLDRDSAEHFSKFWTRMWANEDATNQPA